MNKRNSFRPKFKKKERDMTQHRPAPILKAFINYAFFIALFLLPEIAIGEVIDAPP